MTLADEHARDLREAGVRYLFGVPGSGSSYAVLDACERTGIPFILTAHEGAGVMMAGAATRLTRRPGAALAIKGPGVVNQVPGIGLALFEAYPVLTISESFGLSSPAGAQHKRLPQDALVSALVKASGYESTPRVVPRLLAQALAEPAGPVHLHLADGPDPAVEPPAGSRDHGRDDVLAAIDRANRPVIVLGSTLVRRPGHRASPWRSPVPVFTTAAAKGVYDEADPMAAGVLTGAGGELAPERALLASTDLVVGVGLRTSELLGVSGIAGKVVLVDDVARSQHLGLEPIATWTKEASEALDPVMSALDGKRWGEDQLAQARHALVEHWRTDDCLPAALYAVMASVPWANPARLVTDSGNFTVVAEHLWVARSADAFTGSSNGRFMGAALAQAIGLSLHDRTHPVICTVGDGGFPPLVADLRIAVEQRLPLLIVLLSDGHFGSMRMRVESRGWTPTGIRVARPSWRRVVESMDCPSRAVTSVAAFDEAVRQWQPEGGPAFIEVSMPPDPYARLLQKVRP